MNRTLSKKTIALILALATLVAVLLNNATNSLQPSLIEKSAVISGDHATLYLLPSRYTATIGICFEGQRLTIWKPSIFGFHRARCNDAAGWIPRENVTVTD